MSTSDPSSAPTSAPPAPTPMDVQAAVAHSADAAELFGTAPALLIELQVAVGELAAAASRLTERGRRPFRPDEAWGRALGEVAYRAYLLADQTGVPLDRSVYATADAVFRRSQQRPTAAGGDDWPVKV